MIYTSYPNDFWHVFLAIATNIHRWLKTGFVLQAQGHIYISIIA